MASHLDLEEQEQLANFKHFWSQYGNLISWVLIAALTGLAAFNGWQYWQRKSAQEAAALYDELERAVQAGEADKVQRVWADVQAKAGRAQQGQQAGLLAASSLHGAGKSEEARKALAWVIDQSSDSALIAVARLRRQRQRVDHLWRAAQHEYRLAAPLHRAQFAGSQAA